MGLGQNLLNTPTLLSGAYAPGRLSPGVADGNITSSANMPSYTAADQKNMAFGYGAFNALTSGLQNTAVGHDGPGYNLTSGNENTAIGNAALQRATSANNNTAVGSGALYSSVTGDNNTAVGMDAHYWPTGSANNVAVGHQALYGQQNGVNPYGYTTNNNTAIGANTLQNLTTGANETALGFEAGLGVTTGNNNTMVGYLAGQSPGGNSANATTTGSNQTLIGTQTGQGGSGNTDSITCIGYNTTASVGGGVAIGTDHTTAGAAATQADMIALGTAIHQVKISNNTAGAGSAALGANCPATTLTAPYTWFKMYSNDGSTVYVPAWK